ncbi:Pol polyprotein [Plakobranchus ocellatus]|uniref:Pol polyprotein n=1 Tax=Plakobranchus ocellatus TaxID=259542 RepID=A0AAV4ABF9_9GAST|nr:Pol polyprotein [Plakobranchus ocellatus]
MVYAATRWPETVPLKCICIREVAETLFGIFSRLASIIRYRHTQQRQTKDLLTDFSGALSDLPGKTNDICFPHSTNRPQAFHRQTIFCYTSRKSSRRKGSREQVRVRNNKTTQLTINASPITVVMRTNFRKLNSITILDAKPISALDELLAQMEGVKYFTKFDLTKGFWQIPMCESDKKYTAFQTSRGLMEFNYMRFRLSTTACTFKKAMKAILGTRPFVVSYFDEVLVFSTSGEENLVHVEKTPETLQRANFTLSPLKQFVR